MANKSRTLQRRHWKKGALNRDFIHCAMNRIRQQVGVWRAQTQAQAWRFNKS